MKKCLDREELAAVWGDSCPQSQLPPPAEAMDLQERSGADAEADAKQICSQTEFIWQTVAVTPLFSITLSLKALLLPHHHFQNRIKEWVCLYVWVCFSQLAEGIQGPVDDQVIFPVHQVNIAVVDAFFCASAVLRIQHHKRVYPKQTPLPSLAHLRCVAKPKTHHRYSVTPNLQQGLCSGFVSWGCWNIERGFMRGAVPWRREKGRPEPASHSLVQLPRGVGRPAAMQLGLAQQAVTLINQEDN